MCLVHNTLPGAVVVEAEAIVVVVIVVEVVALVVTVIVDIRKLPPSTFESSCVSLPRIQHNTLPSM